jgi:acetoin utilization protein AcuB
MIIGEAMNRTLVTIDADASIEAAIALSLRTGADHLLVLDEETLVGVLCACDLREALPGEHVCDRMSVPVMTVRPDTPVEEVAAIMEDCALGCIPVTAGGLILGTVGERDLERCGVHPAHPHRSCHSQPGAGAFPH